MSAEFRLLGDVEVYLDSGTVPIGYAQLRCALTVLLIEANRTVSVDELVDRVWGERQLPRRPRGAVQHTVTLLRNALAAVPDVAIEWRATGYQITLDAETVDLHRFRRLVDEVRTTADDTSAVGAFDQALRLWRGEPFRGLDTPWLDRVRATLTQQYQAVRLDLTDIRLRLGHHGALLAELSGQVDQHPLDERLAGQYMLALYRSGRQAEALTCYQHIRRRLADELGADPSQPLRQLHQGLLTGDPALTDTTGDRTSWSARPVVPRQLPAAPPGFTGRATEVARLSAIMDERADRTMVISVISGIGGIGKTWLSLYWAHHNLDRFPDGQLHVNLRGFDPTGEPTPPAVVVRGFLAALGVSPGAIPNEVDAQIGLYRGILADKRMLVVLDNARDSEQVTPLLPGTPTCTVLVTSRSQLTGLVTRHGARAVRLDVLEEREARALFARLVGQDRVTAEPEATAELLASCAGLPLAISVAAARAAGQPRFGLRALADELRDTTTRLDALDTGELGTNLRAVLSWSRHALDRRTATAFELLGLIPGADISLPAAANLVDLPTVRARVLLRELENAHLVQQHLVGRYRMHDLVRLSAADPADPVTSTTQRTAALRRLVDSYLYAALAADRLLDRYRPPVDAGQPDLAVLPQPPHNETVALAWFTTEHANLLASQQLAAERGWHTVAWQLAWALNTFHRLRGHLRDDIAVGRIALTAAQRLDALSAQAVAHRLLGNALARSGKYEEGVGFLRRALDLAERADDPFGQAHAHALLGDALHMSGDDHQALEHAVRATRLFRTVHQPVWAAWALGMTGWLHARLGRYRLAHSECEAALAEVRRCGDREGEATTLDSLAYVACRVSEHARAIDYYRQALALLRDIEHSFEQATTLDNLAQVHQTIGQHDEARAVWRQALALYQAQHRDADADRVRHQLAD
jgi:DNA-binding SARP family transcriptional activator